MQISVRCPALENQLAKLNLVPAMSIVGLKGVRVTKISPFQCQAFNDTILEVSVLNLLK